MIHDLIKFDKYNFNGGNLSSDGGALLLLKYISRNELFSFLNRLSFNDSRKNPIHSNLSILIQTIVRTLLGYFNQHEQAVLDYDPLLFQDQPVASQPTVSRFFDRITRNTVVGFKHFIHKQACAYVNRHTQDPILDADSTLVTTDGNQEAASYIHHYGETGYHPILINEYHTKLLLCTQLRTGSSYSANDIVEELKEIMPMLSGKDHKRIRFRGDSAFYNNELMTYLEAMNCTYYIRVKGFHKINNLIMNQIYKKKINPDNYTAEKPYYGEIRYQMSGSNEKRRVCFKVYSTMEKDGQLALLPMIYCVMTNEISGNAQSIMEFYEARGNSENFTKELKDDFHGEKLSHQTFIKNEMAFLIAAFAYNLFHMFQNDILEKEDQVMRMKSYRSKYQKIAVKVVRHAREIHLHFSSAYPRKQAFNHYMNKVMQT